MRHLVDKLTNEVMLRHDVVRAVKAELHHLGGAATLEKVEHKPWENGQGGQFVVPLKLSRLHLLTVGNYIPSDIASKFAYEVTSRLEEIFQEQGYAVVGTLIGSPTLYLTYNKDEKAAMKWRIKQEPEWLKALDEVESVLRR